jgi:HlyD family secretion protein
MKRAEAPTPAENEGGSPQVVRLVLPDLRARRRRRNVVAAIVLAAIAGGGYFAWRASEPDVDLVRVERPARRTVVRTVAINGHLDVEQRIEVVAPTGGRLNAIEVRPGDTVEQNQPLAYLDQRGTSLVLDSAQSTVTMASMQVASARVALETARTNLTRQEDLVARGLASEADLTSVRAQVQQAQAAVRAAVAQEGTARNSLESARLGHEFTILRAPMAGVVLRAPTNIGSLVGPERGPLFTIGSALSSLRIDGSIGEADIGEVRVGQSATFEVPAFPGRTFNAVVTHIEPQASVDAASTTYPIHFRAENPDGVLMQGMTAMLRIEVARAENALSVPEAALRFTPEGAPEAQWPRSRVWRRTGPNQLEPIDVAPGVSDGAYTEVRAVHAGELHEDDDIAIGLHPTEDGSAPGLTLGGRRRRGNAR